MTRKFCPSRRLWLAYGLLGALWSLPSLGHAAPDEETRRLENAVLCQTMPYRCVKGVYTDRVETEGLRPHVKTVPPVPRQSPPVASADMSAALQNIQDLILSACIQYTGLLHRQSMLTMEQLPDLRACLDSMRGKGQAVWPTPHTREDHIVLECAKAQGLEPSTAITMQQLNDLGGCALLLNRALPR